MIRRIMFLIFMLVVFSGESLAAAVEIEPTSLIQHITVYPDSAMIKKQAVFSRESIS